MLKRREIKMKIRQIVNALPALNKLAGCELTLQKLYNIQKLMGNLETEIAFYDKQRNKILTKYCDVVGNQYVPREADVEQLNAELNELLETDIECEIKEVALGINEDIKLSYNDLVQLEGFVRIEGED